MIEELLALWQETRSDELAASIAQFSAANPRPPITGATQRALHAAWNEIAAAHDPLDVDRLLATLASGNLTQANERLQHLATRPPDPRIATGLEAVLANPPSAAFVKGTSIGLWDALFARLAAIADPRTSKIHERIPWLAHDRAPSPFDLSRLRTRTASRVAKVAQSIPPSPVLTPAQQVRIAELTTRVRATPPPVDRAAELLARIYDQPHDLDARSVYADWLTAHGDPRGELIALQLARPSRRRDPGSGTSPRRRPDVSEPCYAPTRRRGSAAWARSSNISSSSEAFQRGASSRRRSISNTSRFRRPPRSRTSRSATTPSRQAAASPHDPFTASPRSARSAG